MTKRKLDVLDVVGLFCEVVLSRGKVRAMRAHPLEVSELEDTPSSGYFVSWEMANELAKEAWAYKDFADKAIFLAKLIDNQKLGFRIARPIMEKALDEYSTAKDTLLRMQLTTHYADVEIEDGSPTNH